MATIISNTVFVLTQSCSRNDLIFSRFDNRSMNASTEHVLYLKNVQSPGFMFRYCRNNGSCRSINVFKENGSYNCQLLSVDRFTLPMVNLTTTINVIYFESTEIIMRLNKQFKAVVEEAADCLEVYQKGFKENGIYEVRIGDKNVKILCDMTTPPFGWTVMQKRFDGSVDFYQIWTVYKNGFGNLKTEFWLGNEYVHLLTTGKSNLLRFELKTFNGERYTKSYTDFYIGTSDEKYKLILGGEPSDNDAVLYHNGMKFSTYDQDNDLANNINCAVKFHGAWWYNNCQRSSLNGKYRPSETAENQQGIFWKDRIGELYTGNKRSLQETEIKFRKQL